MERDKGVKFILLGDGSVGKTCLMLKFTGKPIRVNHIKTIGIDMDKRIFRFEDRDMQVTIWDTAGQERYRNSIPKNIFNRLNGALLVYDVTNRKTFNSVSEWMKLIEENAPQNTSVILVANKIDKPLVVSEAEGRALASTFGIPFIMTSAIEGTNVEEAFKVLLKCTIEKDPKLFEMEHQGHSLDKDTSNKRLCCR